ncbi:SWIM zinc finger family protein [Methanonatronarchaeum sp. AMET-Sl]|uniref:SWIM zinc finger family protein n=1 Tax=Methanonatronarchaeum sp. AMET-Sl TaxID=3037654 RepID=UPI00244DA36D|nr:SWIM zinc finger family protein [Methanonatronarchaeum sp. AMET-Sl]WGI17317.1 SWIM zinc finger family protein [Methanonatronarchaeum sp. AMET-Sl]
MELGYITREIELSDIEEDVIEIHGKRGEKAVKGVKKDCVKKYRDFWVVVGSEDHVVINDAFCDCEDYLYEVSSRNSDIEYCWHAIAVKLAKKTGLYSEVDVWYHEIKKNL